LRRRKRTLFSSGEKRKKKEEPFLACIVRSAGLYRNREGDPAHYLPVERRGRRDVLIVDGGARTASAPEKGKPPTEGLFHEGEG